MYNYLKKSKKNNGKKEGKKRGKSYWTLKNIYKNKKNDSQS